MVSCLIPQSCNLSLTNRQKLIMSLLLLVFFIIVPIVEIVLLIEIGGAIGAGATLLLILATAVAGVGLVRLQGMSVLREAQRELGAGRAPAKELAHGALLLLAGLLLIVPGFFTDFIGFLLLLPPFRTVILDYVLGALMANFTAEFFEGRFHPDDRRPDNDKGGVIEGEFTIIDKNDSKS